MSEQIPEEPVDEVDEDAEGHAMRYFNVNETVVEDDDDGTVVEGDDED